MTLSAKSVSEILFSALARFEFLKLHIIKNITAKIKKFFK